MNDGQSWVEFGFFGGGGHGVVVVGLGWVFLSFFPPNCNQEVVG